MENDKTNCPAFTATTFQSIDNNIIIITPTPKGAFWKFKNVGKYPLKTDSDNRKFY